MKSVLLELLEVRQAALQRHARIKNWRLTEAKAMALAEQTSFDQFRAFEHMKEGRAYVLGAPIRVVQ